MVSSFLRDLKNQVLLGFRLRWYFYMASVAAVLVLWFVPFTGIRIPSSETYIFVAVFALPLFAGFIAAGFFFASALSSNIQIVVYDKRHTPETSVDPDLKALAASKGVDYSNPIRLTDNPGVDTAYTNPVKRLITFPRSWQSRYPRELFLGAGMHEIGHIKFRRQFFKELLIAGLLTTGFSLFLSLRLGWAIVLIGEVTFLLLAFTIVSHRSELRCDRLAAETMGKAAMISLLEDLGRKYGFDNGSETHPPIRYRIKELERLP